MAGFGHVAVGMLAGRWYCRGADGPTRPVTTRELVGSMIAFSALSMAPDLDVWAFRLGIPYEAPFGHRGASHSLLVAFAVAGLLAFAHRPPEGLRRARGWLALVIGAVVVSHGLLDTLTYGGGHGVALLWPFDATRLWSPLRLIPVSPIGFGIFSPAGLRTIGAELLLFAPCWLYAVWPRRGARSAPVPCSDP